MNTDFVAVFEKLLLPMAVKHKLKKEDMVKQVFVFSDMQFDSAENGYSYSRRDPDPPGWATSYERIKVSFAAAGYDMPRLIFWNLAGGRAVPDASDSSTTSTAAPKPVQAHEQNTALVSGYSQGQLKMFLAEGSFEDPEGEEEEVVDEVDEDGDVVVGKAKKKRDTLEVVRKAIGHEAYRMLRVVD
jgi:hypothetical protein